MGIESLAMGIQAGLFNSPAEIIRKHIDNLTPEQFEMFRSAFVLVAAERNISISTGEKIDAQKKLADDWKRKEELADQLLTVLAAEDPDNVKKKVTIKTWCRAGDKRVYLIWGDYTEKWGEAFLDYYKTGNRKEKPGTIETYAELQPFAERLRPILDAIAKFPGGEVWLATHRLDDAKLSD